MERLVMTLDDIYIKVRKHLDSGPIIIENVKITNISYHKDVLFLKGISCDKIEMEIGFFISDKHYHKRKDQLINYLLKTEGVWYD